MVPDLPPNNPPGTDRPNQTERPRPDMVPDLQPNNTTFSNRPQVGPLNEQQSLKTGVDVGHQLMKDFGLTKEQASGIVGNLYHESAGMNANVNEFGSEPGRDPYGPPNGTQFGYGWAQWTGDRKDSYLNFCRQNQLDPSSPAANYAMLKHELQTTEKASLESIKQATTAEDAAYRFRKDFERAASPVDEKRLAATRMLSEYM